MTEKEIIIENFVKNFVQKSKAERVLFELSNPKKRYKFTNKLNHNWEDIFKSNCLFWIDKKDDLPEKVKEFLHFSSDEICYIISNCDDFDDQLLAFGEVFEKIYNYGFASLLVNINGDKFLLITEQIQGPAPKFIGKMK